MLPSSFVLESCFCAIKILSPVSELFLTREVTLLSPHRGSLGVKGDCRHVDIGEV